MKLKLLSGSLLILGSACMTEAYAEATCTPSNGFTTLDVDMTLGRIVILPSDPVGKVLKKASIPYSSNQTKYNCTTDSVANLYGKLVQNPTISSLGDYIYNTNIPGVGIRLSRTNLHSNTTRYYPYTYAAEKISNGWFLADGIFNIEIIKTAPTTGSGPISPGVYTKHYIGATNASRPSLTTTLRANAITIASSSCEIQGSINKIVTLPTVTKDKFKGIGTTAGEQDFGFDILCNGGENPTNVAVSTKISLSFDFNANPDLKSIVNSAAQNTQAQGVSVQLINKYQNANQIITKGSTHLLGTVNSNQTLTYNVPLSARYIQTGQTVTAGKVRGLATMTIEYN